MFAGWLMHGSLAAKLKQSGKTAQGTVTAANSHYVSTGTTTRMEERQLSVIYMVDLKMFSKDFRVTEKGLSEHPQGSKVEVLYNPSDPEESVLVGDFALESASTAWIGGTMFGVLTLGLFWYAIRSKRRQAS